MSFGLVLCRDRFKVLPMRYRELLLCKNRRYHFGFDDIFSLFSLSVSENVEFLRISYFREKYSIEVLYLLTLLYLAFEYGVLFSLDVLFGYLSYHTMKVTIIREVGMRGGDRKLDFLYRWCLWSGDGHIGNYKKMVRKYKRFVLYFSHLWSFSGIPSHFSESQT
jgi:hypothetical protein